MTRRILIIVALLAFVITLAVVIGTRLSGIAAAVGFGVAIGVSVGVPVGVGMAYAIHRWGLFPPEKAHYATWDELEPGMLVLTPDQADALLGNLEQGRTSAAPRPSLDRSGRQDREFTVVGGGGLDSSPND